MDTILQKYNHIWLPFKGNSKTLTRQQIPVKLRRRGLWITYKSCKGTTVTEWYNSDNFQDSQWGKNENWVLAADSEIINKAIKEALKWYKDIGGGDINSLFHWYGSTVSFIQNLNLGNIPKDSIAFLGLTGQVYVQGKLLGVSTEEFNKLQQSVAKVIEIFGGEEGLENLDNLSNILNFFEGFTDDTTLKEILDKWEETLDNKVDKEKGKGLSTNDFTDELKTKLEELEPMTKEELTTILN